jgi:hypothetical protein
MLGPRYPCKIIEASGDDPNIRLAKGLARTPARRIFFAFRYSEIEAIQRLSKDLLDWAGKAAAKCPFIEAHIEIPDVGSNLCSRLDDLSRELSLLFRQLEIPLSGLKKGQLIAPPAPIEVLLPNLPL